MNNYSIDWLIVAYINPVGGIKKHQILAKHFDNKEVPLRGTSTTGWRGTIIGPHSQRLARYQADSQAVKKPQRVN